ncbi:tRNA-splicing endonuclease subunit Sen2-like isoform X2 [Symsagittifera roscoffensis]|uniref:tRNA-splicing endonuclease subunit Sen2-like isoform X2 n=1 Tax=Symsagittifera roscoffensis TaxID=84072 RepID=UPI00307C2024
MKISCLVCLKRQVAKKITREKDSANNAETIDIDEKDHDDAGYPNEEAIYVESSADFADIDKFLRRRMDDFPDIAQPKTSSNDHISGNTTLKVQRTKEFVCLTSLETFFLAQLGFLELQLSVEELYRTLSERQCCFAFLLTAFYYYRAKGWIVRPGQSFGCDFLLYKDGPSYTHSAYGVIVQCKSNGPQNDHDKTKLCNFCVQKKSNCDASLEYNSWKRCLIDYTYKLKDISATCRVLNVTNKDLILCKVTALTDNRPKFNLDQFDVCEVSLARWVPK